MKSSGLRNSIQPEPQSLKSNTWPVKKSSEPFRRDLAHDGVNVNNFSKQTKPNRIHS